MFEIREIINKTEYNPLSISKQTPFTQAWFYGEWQKMVGRKVRRFEIICPRRTSLGLERDSESIGFFQVIKYPLPFSQNFLYIPHAPLLRQDYGGQADFLREFYKKLSQIAKEENAVFVRFDLYFHNWNYGSMGNLDKYFKKVPPYAYHSSYFQPKFEWCINLTKTEDELFNEMHPKNRYNIRLAEKKGVEVEIIRQNFRKYFDDFYRLLRETAKRDNFNLHPKTYYQNVFATLEENNAFLAVARYEEKMLLINLILLYGRAAHFAFGGSSDEYKNLMAPHLSHWRGIIEAKNRGYKFYNFGGVSGNGGKELEGVSFFKKRFGGELLEYSDSYDAVLKPFWHWLYNMRQKIR